MTCILLFYQSCREINYNEGIRRNQKNKLRKFRLLSVGITNEICETTGMGKYGLYQSHINWEVLNTGKGLDPMRIPCLTPCKGCSKVIWLSKGIDGHWITQDYENGPLHYCKYGRSRRRKSLKDVANENIGILV